MSGVYSESVNHTFGIRRPFSLGLVVATIATSVLATTVALLPSTVVQAAPVADAYAMVKQIPVGGNPVAVAVRPGGDFVYVVNNASNSASVIDTTTGLVSTTISATQVPNPTAIAIRPQGDRAYIVSDSMNKLGTIDLTTNVVNHSTLGGGASLSAIAITPDGSRAYIARRSDDKVLAVTVSALNIDLNFGVLSVGNNPVDLAITPDGSRVWVANRGTGTTNASLSIIATSTSAVTTLTPITDHGRISQGMRAVAIHPSTTSASVAGANGYFGYFANDTPFGAPTGDFVRTAEYPIVSSFLTELETLNGVGDFVATNEDPVDVAVATENNLTFWLLRATKRIVIYEGKTPQGFLGLSAIPSDMTSVAFTPRSTTSAATGLPAYVTNGSHNNVQVIDKVTPSFSTTSGPAGSTVTITLDAPNVAYDMDNDTLTSVKFGNTAVTPTPGPGDTWTATVPSGSGSVRLQLGFNGSASTTWFDNFTYSGSPVTSGGSSAIVPLWKAKLDSNGGTCVDGTSRSGAWTREFLGSGYLPGPTDCTRPGFTFAGWANASTPTVVRNLPLLIDPSSDTRRYFVAENVDLIANWTPSPRTPTVFLGITDWICRGCGVLFFWDTPASQSTPNITAGSGLPLCTKPENLFSLGDWTLCHERSATRGTYNLAIGSTRLTITIG